jgi:hypothetical protein
MGARPRRRFVGGPPCTADLPSNRGSGATGLPRGRRDRAVLLTLIEGRYVCYRLEVIRVDAGWHSTLPNLADRPSGVTE